jgi:hypothetical protein
MQIRDYVEALVKAERNAHTSDLTIEGVNIWPVFRAQTVSMFRNPEAYRKSSEPHKVVLPGFIQRISESISKRKLTEQIENQAAQIAQRIGDARVLFFSRDSNHSDRIDDKYSDRFCDPFIDFLKSNGVACAKIELSGPYNSSKSRRTESVLIDETAFKKQWYLESAYRKSLISQAAKIQADANAIADLSFVTRHVQSAILEIWYYRSLFTVLFEKLKPEFIFYKCYYEHDAAGLTLAAREAGIKTVDIQHGKQGEFHPMYSHFTAIPDGGYQLLPDYFWSWGEKSARNITDSRGGKSAYHIPVVGGNLWMAQWKGSIPAAFEKDSEKVPERWNAAGKKVLFTMQPLDEHEMVPGAVKRAILQSPQDWLWLIRRHPLQKISDERILELLGNPSPERVDIAAASALPLFQVLKYADHHVTQWSSVIFEADNFGVRSSVAGSKGASIYAAYIADGTFRYAENEEQLLSAVSEARSESDSIPYIETSESIVRAAFRKLNILTSDGR